MVVFGLLGGTPPDVRAHLHKQKQTRLTLNEPGMKSERGPLAARAVQKVASRGHVVGLRSKTSQGNPLVVAARDFRALPNELNSGDAIPGADALLARLDAARR